jgi:hypothetical protein
VSRIVKAINDFFRNALKKDIDGVKEKIMLTERQNVIFKMFYLDGKDIGFIADTLCVCPMVINNELKKIRIKIAKALDLDE